MNSKQDISRAPSSPHAGAIAGAAAIAAVFAITGAWAERLAHASSATGTELAAGLDTRPLTQPVVDRAARSDPSVPPVPEIPEGTPGIPGEPVPTF